MKIKTEVAAVILSPLLAVGMCLLIAGAVYVRVMCALWSIGALKGAA